MLNQQPRARHTVMFNTRWRRINYPEVVSAGASIVCGRAIVPHDHNLLGGLEVPDGAYVTLAAVLKISFNIHHGSACFRIGKQVAIPVVVGNKIDELITDFAATYERIDRD